MIVIIIMIMIVMLIMRRKRKRKRIKENKKSTDREKRTSATQIGLETDRRTNRPSRGGL